MFQNLSFSSPLLSLNLPLKINLIKKSSIILNYCCLFDGVAAVILQHACEELGRIFSDVDFYKHLVSWPFLFSLKGG